MDFKRWAWPCQSHTSSPHFPSEWLGTWTCGGCISGHHNDGGRLPALSGLESIQQSPGNPLVENYPTPEASSTPIEKHHAFFIKILSTSVN